MLLEKILLNDVQEMLKQLAYQKQEKHYAILKTNDMLEIYPNIQPYINADDFYNCDDTLNIANEHIGVNKIDKMPMLFLLDYLKSLKIVEERLYGVIVKIDGKFYNPFHCYKVEEFVRVVNENINSECEIYKYFFKRLDYDISDNIIREYQEKIQKAFADYTEKMYKRNFIQRMDEEELNNGRNAVYDLLFKNNDYKFSRFISTKPASNENLIAPVSLATNELIYPYYGLIALYSDGKDGKITGVNLEPDFRTGNIRHTHYDGDSDTPTFEMVHIDEDDEELWLNDTDTPNSAADLFYYDDDIGRFRINIIEGANHLWEYSRKIMSEDPNMSGGRMADMVKMEIENLINKYSGNMLTEKSCEIRDTECFREYVSEISRYETCFGSESPTFFNADVLDNMNIHSMYVSRQMSKVFEVKAMAYQLVSQDLIDVFQQLYNLNKTEEK